MKDDGTKKWLIGRIPFIVITLGVTLMIRLSNPDIYMTWPEIVVWSAMILGMNVGMERYINWRDK